MRTLRYVCYCLLCITFSTPLQAEDQPGKNPHSPQSFIQPAEKEVMKITDSGLDPKVVRLRNLDGSVFFVNTSKQSLASIQVDFGKRRVHCATQNLSMDDKGVMRSIKPIGPKDFALMCFPEVGEYRVAIKGVGESTSGLEGKVIVE